MKSIDCHYNLVKEVIDLHHKAALKLGLGIDHPILLETRDGVNFEACKMTPKTLDFWFGAFCSDADLHKVSHAQMRVSVASHGYYRAGFSVDILRDELNHTDSTMTRLKYIKKIPGLCPAEDKPQEPVYKESSRVAIPY